MFWSKIGRPILREVNNSGFFLWFICGKVYKVIRGNCWHLLMQEEKSLKSLRAGKPLTTKSVQVSTLPTWKRSAYWSSVDFWAASPSVPLVPLAFSSGPL